MRSALRHILLTASLFCLSTLLLHGQIRVSGTVYEEETREPLPFVSVFFEGTTIGTETDDQGRFELVASNLSSAMLCAQLVGYLPQGITVRAGREGEVNFYLKLDRRNLQAAYVRPDNHYLKSILKQIDAHRKRNNPDTRRAYTSEFYNKTQIDLKNPEVLGPLIKGLKVVEPYMKIDEHGQKVLPAFFLEGSGKRYHSSVPEINKEEILATRISGLLDNNVVEPYTGSIYLHANFYDNFVDVLGVKVPSPLAPGASVYYNYYLIDSLDVQGRKTFYIRYHPKKLVSNPVFDGEMYIDAEDFALQRMKAKLDNTGAVNWVRAMDLDQTNRKQPDGSWFYDDDRMYIDFSFTVKQLSKTIAVVGHRHLVWGEPDYSQPVIAEKVLIGDEAVVNKPVARASDEYWAEHRSEPLNAEEQGIYDMVDAIQQQPLYNLAFWAGDLFSTGYIPLNRKIGIGTYSNFVSFNDIDGFRMSIGFQTKKGLSRDWRLTGKLAYGFGSKQFRGMLRYEQIFTRLPWRKLKVQFKHDISQLGRSNAPFLDEGNILTSVTSKRGLNKYMPLTEFTVNYEREIRGGFTNSIGYEYKRIFANHNVPMIRPDGTAQSSSVVNQLHYTARFTWHESVLRGDYYKDYVQTDYPIVTVDVIGAKKGLVANDVEYLRGEMTVNWHLKTPPLGYANVRFNAGKVFGHVPYQLLKLHEGNPSFLYDPVSFSCMRYYEFASDAWATLAYEHEFGGFFLGRIPLIRDLNWREHVLVKAAYGTISPKNNGSLENTQAMFLFPEGMSDLSTPYVEVGAGFSNIFHLLRVTGVWRLTHRLPEPEDSKRIIGANFAVNLGFKVQF